MAQALGYLPETAVMYIVAAELAGAAESILVGDSGPQAEATEPAFVVAATRRSAVSRIVDFEQKIAAVDVSGAAASRLVAASESESEAEAVVAALVVQAEEIGSVTAGAALV